MTATSPRLRRRLSLVAVASCAAGIAGLVAANATPWLAGALGIVAVVLAVRVRPALRTDDGLLGAGFAGVGFVTGVVGVALVTWMLAFPIVAAAIDGMTR